MIDELSCLNHRLPPEAYVASDALMSGRRDVAIELLAHVPDLPYDLSDDDDLLTNEQMNLALSYYATIWILQEAGLSRHEARSILLGRLYGASSPNIVNTLGGRRDALVIANQVSSWPDATPLQTRHALGITRSRLENRPPPRAVRNM